MCKLFVDNLQFFPSPIHNYHYLKDYEECVKFFGTHNEIDLLNIDYNLGKKTGMDVLAYMKENHIKVKQIIIRGSNETEIQIMRNYIEKYFKKSEYVYTRIK